MQLSKRTWDVERVAAWLRRHLWDARGEESAPPQGDVVVHALEVESNKNVVQENEEEEIDIAGWPALVAPFYD